MHIIRSIVFFGLAAGGVYWLYETQPEFRKVADQFVQTEDLLTLEAKYTAEQIIKRHSREVQTDKEHSLQEPRLTFHPHLLLEVKFTQSNKKTCEGVVLWSMVDGEIVLNTDTWEKTHGFEDAIKACANRADFTIMNALAKNKGSMTRERLINELHLDQETLDPWVDNARRKQLIVQKGNELQLHFENPKLTIKPQTKITQTFVTKSKRQAPRVNHRYEKKQIEKIARAAFGQDFTIREVKQVFLPVYNVEVLNPDGSILSSEWNALNGKRIIPNYLGKTS